MKEPLLAIDALGISIDDTPLVRNLSLRVASGEILGLVGASGAGKSLTALSIMQLLPAGARLSGSVVFQGTALTGKDPSYMRDVRGRAIGMVFQEPMTALNPLMRIGAQVAETVRLHRALPAAQAMVMAREALDSVGLTGEQGALDRYPHELSGGQRQRVAIAIAIVLRPALLIADEPTTALDVVSQAPILTLLRQLADRHGMGLILVSHDVAVIARVTDRVAVMTGGEIVEQGRTVMLRQFRHPYSRSLLAAARLTPQPLPGRIKSPDVVLDVRDIVHDYPLRKRSLWQAAPVFRALDGVSLTVHAGESVALVGESGSGKSSLLRAIIGLQRVQSGQVRLLGESFSTARGATLRRLRRSVQAVFQDPYGSFDPQWRVARLIAEPFHLMEERPSAAERALRVARVLEQVGLSSTDGARFAHEFSGGQRQRIAIARALVTEPALIVLDEALSALDVLVRAQILDLLADLAQRLQIAYLFVAHDLNAVHSFADRVYVMQRGRIVEEGATDTVFTTPQHPYTRLLIDAMPQLGTSTSAV